MIISNEVKIIIFAILLLASFIFGHKISTWQHESQKNETQNAVQLAISEYHKSEAIVSDLLESKLSELKSNERIIHRETSKIIDRPIYSNVCLDDDGLRIIERSRIGGASFAEKSNAVLQ